MDEQLRYKTTRRASIVSAIANTLLAVSKVIVGILGHSTALVADGLHSFSDLITDALVLIAAKAGGHKPDRGHPYGHRRIETIAAIIIALILFIVAVSIVYDAGVHFFSKVKHPPPDWAVLVMAIISIFVNEWLYRYALGIGKRIQSQLLISNAWHNRSDAFSSIIVLLSAGGAMLGWHHLDAIGAALIALFIFKMAGEILWQGIRELIDTAVDDKTLKELRQIISTVPGVVSIHELRTRLHSGNILVDLHILVNPFISVSEGHYIGEQVRSALYQQAPSVTDVIIHVDPEDDEGRCPSADLPNRQNIEKILREAWKNLPSYHHIERIMLHYIAGKLYIEVFFATQDVAARTLKPLYQKATTDLDYVANVMIHCQ